MKEKKKLKECHYCKNKRITQIISFNFPINCVCCNNHHVMEVNCCNKCKPVQPSMIAVALWSSKVLDPINQGLFLKIK